MDRLAARTAPRILLLLAAFLAPALLGGCLSVERMAAAPPTATATLTPTVTNTPTESPIPPTVTLLPSETSSPTLPPTETPTPTPSDTPEPTITSTITPGPSPTATRSATPTRRPTNTRIPTRTRPPTNTPTITPTPTPPIMALRIERPGLFSKVSSPFRTELRFQVGEDGWVRLRLVGEDGRTIVEQELDYRKYPGRIFWGAPYVNFNITGAAETGRLEMSTLDEFGRLQSLSSVDLILLKTGKDEITPPDLYWEPYLVRYPPADTIFSGGTVVVIGLARPVNPNPVIFELIDEQGRVVGSSQLVIPDPTGDLSHTPFQVGIPYDVSETTNVRLTIRQESAGRVPGTVALASRKLALEP